MGYTTTIIEVGPAASDFLEESMAITFAGNAPEELRSYCFVIEAGELTGSLAVGQPVLIGDQEWTITAVGDVVEKNLGNLGHVTLVFDGAAEPRLPGALHLKGSHDRPALEVGTRLVIGNA
ncbi:MAG: PTS glucitol/sorbitol transporter subunit IIA [Propionibacteriaceae bacterium]|nr:PTS glucitol/sorbitol transporter subunit IIA [Propionibacteriaceae bacterium]